LHPFSRRKARYERAFAVFRIQKDIDFLVDTTTDNISRIKSALAILSDNAAAEVDERDVERYSVVRVADEIIVNLLAKRAA
jgi:hypothetical protein